MTNTRTTITAVLMLLFLSPIAQATDGPSAVISQPTPHDLVLTDHTGTPNFSRRWRVVTGRPYRSPDPWIGDLPVNPRRSLEITA